MAAAQTVAVPAEAVELKIYAISFKTYAITFESHPISFTTHPVTLKIHPVQLTTVSLTAPVAEPKRAAPPAPAKRSQKKRVRLQISGDILFDFDKSDIRPEAETIRADLASKIGKNFRRATVRVEGHTDAKGSDAYNQALSERRAASVKRWFAEKGKLSPSRITTKGFGETRPVAPNTNRDGSDNPVGRQKNRRVEIVVEGD